MTANAAEHSAAHRRQRVIGALVGSVVGDALGAPFEFGPPGQFSARFPEPARGMSTEMCGGSGWRPGEWTDDTQMALLVAASLLERNGLDQADLFGRFVAWVLAEPADVGIQTRQVLVPGADWRTAARRYFEQGNRAAGNGSLMRTTPAAIFYSRQGVAASSVAARAISDLTHGDPAAGDGCAIFHRLIAAALAGGDPLAVVPEALAEVPSERRGKWAATLATDWTPDQATESNGAVWPTLGTAVWALRRYRSFEHAMRAVIDIGGDTDTVASVTGGLLGATFGIQAIPSRWTTVLQGELPGHRQVADDLSALQLLALRLDGAPAQATEPPRGDGIEPVEVLPGLWLSDLDGVARAPADAVVISLCRTFDRVPQERRRQVYLTDDVHNLDPDAALRDVLDTIEALHAEGQPVLVHCYGGASRTGLVLRAWLRRTQGLSAAKATKAAVRMWPHVGTWNAQFTDVVDRVQPGPTAGDEVSCPECGALSIPIIYGLPGPDLMQASERGDVALGGCMIGPIDPNRQCRSCGHEWTSAQPG